MNKGVLHITNGKLLRALFAPSGFSRLGRSLRSLPRLPHPHFASPGLAAQALIRAGKTSVT